ncbi:MAG: aspartate carbamoyltransferase catalytic subunit, partial [Chloroflexi bacterium]|nr:aspartate carbamoyltransferase catalytic subunit [Chloroflexota bacterium]
METVESTTHGAIISGAFSPPSLGVWRHRHVLDLDDFSKDEVGLVFEIADAMSEVLSREVKQVPTLRGKTIVTMFYEASTRTRASFELAAKSLSAGTISLDAAKSSVSKGESLVDNLRTIQALGADVIVMRHPQSGAPYLATQYLDTAVINAGDGWHAHPSQALLDIYTVRRHLDDLSKLRIAIIGDIMHSRVARSNIWGMNIMGATVVLCGPPTLMPRGLNEFIERCQLSSVVVEPKLESALEGADVIMLLRLQLERQQSGLLPSIREYIQRYQLTERRLSLAKPYALVMHPGPVNEGIEVSPEIAHGR